MNCFCFQTRMLIARSQVTKKRPKALRWPHQQQTQPLESSDNSKNQRECVLKDGKHPICKCEKFKKMNGEERGQKAKELKLCFKCLSDAHQMRNCSGRLCDVNGCGNPHHRLLHRPYKNVEQKKNVENGDEVSNLSSMRNSEVLLVIPVSIGSGSKTLKTFALCDSGASLSFVDESLMKAVNLTGQPVGLNVAGIHGRSHTSSKGLRVKVGDQDGRLNEDIMAYSHPNVNAGNQTYNLKKLKKNISSPVSFEGFYHQLGRSESHLGPRLLALA